MHDTFVVRDAQSVDDRQQSLNRADRRDARLALDLSCQRLALHQLHHQIRVAVPRPTEVENAHQRGVTEPSCSVRLARHARRQSRAGSASPNQLERYVDAQHQRVRHPDDAHAAAADLPHQPVTIADDLASQVRAGLRLCHQLRAIANRGVIANRLDKPGEPTRGRSSHRNNRQSCHDQAIETTRQRGTRQSRSARAALAERPCAGPR